MKHVIKKGYVYGVYTVLDTTLVDTGDKLPSYLVKCMCGREVYRKKSYLLYGDTSRCICIPKEKKFKKGDVYGIYTVVDDKIIMKPTPSGLGFNRFIKCRCICGKVKPVHYHGLTTKRSDKCTCNYANHGIVKGREELYKAWMAMRSKFNRHKVRDESVTMDHRLANLISFCKIMGPSYKEGHHISLIDNKGNYTPKNVAWRARGKRFLYAIDPRTNKTISLIEMASIYNISYNTLRYRDLNGAKGYNLIKEPKYNLQMAVNKAVYVLASSLKE